MVNKTLFSTRTGVPGQAGCVRTREVLHEWGSQEFVPGLVWSAELDNRYIVEVQRVDENTGILYIFDHQDGDRQIHEEKTILMYGAQFGPDVENVGQWEERGVEVVDALNAEKNAE